MSFLAWGNDGTTANLPPIAFLAGVNSASGLNTPEPATWAMLGLGFAGLAGFGFRNRAKQRSVVAA